MTVITIERGAREQAFRGNSPALVSFIPTNSNASRVDVPMTGPPEWSPANGNFDTIDRPFRQAVNRWTGYGVETQTLNVIFSGEWDGTEQADVTSEVVKLVSLGIAPGAKLEPPILRLEGFGVYGRGPDDRWQIQSLTPKNDTLISRSVDGRTCQIEYGVLLARWLPTGVVTTSTPAAKAVAAAGGAPAAPARTYTVKAGDSLSRIAQRELGSANRWKEIADLNGIRDPNRINAGQVLKLP